MSTAYGTSTIAQLTEENRTMYEMAMLPRAVPPFSYLWCGQQGFNPNVSVPENEGTTISWNLLAALSAVTTALNEGVTPTPQNITITSTTATLYEYGAYVQYSKKLVLTGIHALVNEISDALGEQAGDSFDQIVRGTVVAGSTVQYAGAATSTATVAASHKLSAAELLEGVTTLKVAKAQPPVDGKYLVFIHPYAEYDLFNDPTFSAVLSYVKPRDDNNPFINGYLTDAFGCRFYVTPNGTYSSGTLVTYVYLTMMIGRGAFGIGGLASYIPGAVGGQDGNSLINNNTFKKVRPLRLILKGFEAGGTSDPLEQRATIAWWSTFVVKRLTEAFMLRIEHATALGG